MIFIFIYYNHSMQLNIERTKSTPEVKYDPINQSITLDGRCLERDENFWNEVHDGIQKLCENQLTQTLNFKLEYISTATIKDIKKILTTDTKALGLQPLIINWLYEEDDEDMLSKGEDYQKTAALLSHIKKRENLAVAEI